MIEDILGMLCIAAYFGAFACIVIFAPGSWKWMALFLLFIDLTVKTGKFK